MSLQARILEIFDASETREWWQATRRANPGTRGQHEAGLAPASRYRELPACLRARRHGTSQHQHAGSPPPPPKQPVAFGFHGTKTRSTISGLSSRANRSSGTSGPVAWQGDFWAGFAPVRVRLEGGTRRRGTAGARRLVVTRGSSSTESRNCCCRPDPSIARDATSRVKTPRATASDPTTHGKRTARHGVQVTPLDWSLSPAPTPYATYAYSARYCTWLPAPDTGSSSVPTARLTCERVTLAHGPARRCGTAAARAVDTRFFLFFWGQRVQCSRGHGRERRRWHGAALICKRNDQRQGKGPSCGRAVPVHMRTDDGVDRHLSCTTCSSAILVLCPCAGIIDERCVHLRIGTWKGIVSRPKQNTRLRLTPSWSGPVVVHRPAHPHPKVRSQTGQSTSPARK